MTLNNDSEKDKILKKDFRTAQYIYRRGSLDIRFNVLRGSMEIDSDRTTLSDARSRETAQQTSTYQQTVTNCARVR